jgi:hypothetical protein
VPPENLEISERIGDYRSLIILADAPSFHDAPRNAGNPEESTDEITIRQRGHRRSRVL